MRKKIAADLVPRRFQTSWNYSILEVSPEVSQIYSLKHDYMNPDIRYYPRDYVTPTHASNTHSSSTLGLLEQARLDSGAQFAIFRQPSHQGASVQAKAQGL